MAFISLIKLVLYILHLLFEYSFDVSDSESSAKEERPSDISPEVWETRKMLKDPKPDLESVISDLISSGIEANSILRLVDYLNNSTNNQIEEVSTENDQKPIVNICGHLYTLPFNRNSIEKIFPVNFHFPILLLSVVFGFSCCYLPLSLSEQFCKREKWWLSIVCAFSIFSIFKPPVIDPYLTSEQDSWTSLCRPVAITMICTFWSVSIDIFNKYQFIQFPFYSFEINVQKVCPYIFDICRYLLLLLPVWIIVGIIGHPLTTMISILEGCCRYFFGQNGVKNIPHLVIQILRGAMSVSCCWALLKYKMNEITMSLSITIATFLNCIPIYCNRKKMRNVLVSFIYPILLTTTAFISSYCFGFLLIRKGKRTKEIILYFSLAWFVCVDILYPFLNSCQRYFIFHMKILTKSIPYAIFIRNFSQIIVGPLFLFACLFGSSFHPLIISFIIVHSTHKYNTEPHVFAFSVFLTTITLPYDFELTQNYTANLLISLLIAAKVEIFLPQLYFICHARNFYMNYWIKKFQNYEFFLTLYMPFMNWCPFFDLVYKVPSLFWSFFTGSSFVSKLGVPFYSYSSSPHCFYFFDFPHKNDINDKFPFQNINNQCLIEKPIYSSLTKSLSTKFATIVRSGRIGLVNSGDIFLFKKDNFMAMVHVISQEPSVMRIQVRGLQIIQNSISGKREIKRLTEIENKYNYFPNFLHALYSTYYALDFRSKSIPLKAYNINQISVEKILINFEYNQVYELFLASFAFIIAKRKKYIYQCQNSNFEFDENEGPFIEKIQKIVSKCSQNNINNNESLNEDDDSIMLNENEMKIVVNLWKIISSTLFVTEHSQLKNNMFVRSFNGNIPLSEQFLWIYDFPSLLNKIVKPTIQLGCCCIYITSTKNGPQFDSNGQVDVDELVTFLKRTYECTAFANVQSKLFYNAYNDNKIENIISMATIQKVDKIFHLKLCTESWNVFQIMQDWVRSLWSDSLRYFFIYNIKNEGKYISKFNESSFFNTLLEQLNDEPIGNPAYVSEIIDSYVNPFSSDKY